MSSDKKEKKQKRKDKKRRQRRERKGVLPSSVQALLGYLGGGGPGPATQGDTKPRERAGVDAYDTLHQIIKSQQMMSASYMGNLERMAFKTEITKQLKKQGKENLDMLEKTKQDVGVAVEAAVEKSGRQNVKKTPEEKLKMVMGQMKFAERIPAEQRTDSWRLKNEDFQRKASKYQAEINIDRTYSLSLQREAPSAALLPVAPIGQSPGRSSSAPRGGGAVISNRMSIDIAPVATARLPAIDPIQEFRGGGAVLRTPPATRAQEIGAALGGVKYSDATSSSLLTLDISERIGRQQKQLAREEQEVFGGAGAKSGRGKVGSKK
jgi:hypothetical protein